MNNKMFKLEYGAIAKVINYDDTSGLYIYKNLNDNSVSYKSKEYILENEIVGRR